MTQVKFANGYTFVGDIRDSMGYFVAWYPPTAQLPDGVFYAPLILSRDEYKPKPHCTKCYECLICHGVNNAVRIECQYCGTVPSDYSILRCPTRQVIRDSFAMSIFIPVYIAMGCIRQNARRSVRRIMRTVKSDYYATSRG